MDYVGLGTLNMLLMPGYNLTLNFITRPQTNIQMENCTE